MDSPTDPEYELTGVLASEGITRTLAYAHIPGGFGPRRWASHAGDGGLVSGLAPLGATDRERARRPSPGPEKRPPERAGAP